MTTEQRAEKYAMTYSRGLQKTAFRAFGEGYSEGVADQRKIDIDKACSQFRFILGKVCDPLIVDALEEDFREAMEDEK